MARLVKRCLLAWGGALCLFFFFAQVARAALAEPPVVEGAQEGPFFGGGEGNFLAANGLHSPLCRAPGALSHKQQVGCERNGFTAAPVPFGNYSFDVHINTGITEFGNDLDAALEDGLQWLWQALLTVVSVVLLLLEWCYSLHLLGGAVLRHAAEALGGARRAFTTPGLAAVFTFAAIMIAYHGLIRRRYAQTAGEVAAFVAMVCAGLFMIAQPQQTVGLAARWADQGSLGTLAAFAQGTPARAQATLAGSMEAVFQGAVEGPWCFLEFGNVAWCNQPKRLSGPLHERALSLAAQARAAVAKGEVEGADRRELEGEALLLEEARSNGQIFLALPANGPARNSINNHSSLLYLLCGGSSEATACKGPTAREAEFRTQQKVGSRFVGLLLIGAGLLGLVALLAWIALRLLASAVVALLLLLVLPAVVLAPPLGASGRDLFRNWSFRLLAALAAKLLFSVLLGVLLLVERTLLLVEGAGFWLYWLLCASVWWILFFHRQKLAQAFRLVPVAAAPSPLRRAKRLAESKKRTRTALSALRRPLQGPEGGPGAKPKQPGPPPPPSRPPRSPAGVGTSGPSGPATVAESLGALLAREEAAFAGSRRQDRRSYLQRRQALLLHQQEATLQALAEPSIGPRRRARERRREASLLRRQRTVENALAGLGGTTAKANPRLAAQRFIERQLALSGAAASGRERRDYRRLAALMGVEPEAFDRLAAPARRRLILELDRLLEGKKLRGGGPWRAAAEQGPTTEIAHLVALRRELIGLPERKRLSQEHQKRRLRRQLGVTVTRVNSKEKPIK